VPYLSASEVVFHEEALYQEYVPLPLHLPLPKYQTTLGFAAAKECGGGGNCQPEKCMFFSLFNRMFRLVKSECWYAALQICTFFLCVMTLSRKSS